MRAEEEARWRAACGTRSRLSFSSFCFSRSRSPFGSFRCSGRSCRSFFGYFNQRVYRYDALAEHGTKGEIAEVIARYRGELFLLGVALALIGHVPLIGLAMPVYGGLVFIHYGLARLAESRDEPIEGRARRI